MLPLPPNDPDSESATLAAGRYLIPLDDTLAFEIDVPAGTAAHEDGLFLATEEFVVKTEIAAETYGVPHDPCTAQRIDPVGPTVDDLVGALTNLPIYQVSRPQPVEIGGADGAYVEARIPRTYDATQCERGRVQLPGNPATAVGGSSPCIGRWWILAPQTPQSITFTSTS